MITLKSMNYCLILNLQGCKNNSTKEIEYEDDIDKYFAKRHIFGLSVYDLTIYRISFYITVWICVMNYYIVKI
jgi:hypothetical protein